MQAAAFQVVNVKAWIFAIGAMTTFRPTDLPVARAACSSRPIMVVVLPSAGLWAAAAARSAGARRRSSRIVSLVLAGLLAATVVEVWV